MKKVKTIKSGVFMQDSAIQPDENQVSFLPIIKHPSTQSAPSIKNRTRPVSVLSDQQIEEMDGRNADVEAMTVDYILGLIDENGIGAEDVGLDDETVANILDAFEETLSDFGIYIHRPMIVQLDDGEHIVRSAYDEDPEFEEDEYEPG